MKKTILLFLFAVITFSALAQEDTTTSVVVRSGDKYIIDDTITMGAKAFMNFLQPRNSISYETFRSGYRLSNVGWGLFAAGLALGIGSIPVIIAGSYSSSRNGGTDREKADGVYASVALGYSMLVIGDLTTLAGVACVTLGYVRMHQAADNFNVLQAHRRKKQTATKVALMSSRDGLGIALQF